MGKLFGLLFLSMLAMQSPAATLVGATIYGDILFTDYPGIGNCFDPVVVSSNSGCRASGASAPFAPSSPTQPNATITEDDASYPELVFHDKGWLLLSVDIDGSTLSVTVDNTNALENSNPLPPNTTSAPLAWQIRLTGFNANSLSILDILGPDAALFPGLFATVVDEGDGILLDYQGRRSDGGGDYNSDIVALYKPVSEGGDGRLYAEFTIQAVPVPAAVWLFGSGLLGLAGISVRGKAIRQQRFDLRRGFKSR